MTEIPVAGRYQLFQGSSSDITLQTPLWRYMTFEKFSWLVEKSSLYHARLDQLGDPFEGAVTNFYAGLRDTDKIAPYFTQFKENEPWIFKTLRFRQFAMCWHASEHESDALWKLYAPGGAGIAVVSTMERIRKAVEFTPHHHGILGQVEYVDFDHHDMRRGPTVIRPGHLKRKSFDYEREVRGIILAEMVHVADGFGFTDKTTELQRLHQPLGINTHADLKELIQSIVISPTAEPFVEELVQTVAKRHQLDGLVRKSELLKTPAY